LVNLALSIFKNEFGKIEILITETIYFNKCKLTAYKFVKNLFINVFKKFCYNIRQQQKSILHTI